MKNNTQSHKVSNRLLLVAFITLFIINLAFIGYHTSKYGINEESTPIGVVSPQLIAVAVIGMAFMLLILSFVVAAIIALMVNREAPYKTRLWRAFLLTSAIVNALMVINVLFDLVTGS